MQEVSEEIGIPFGSIYHRFGSREDLLGSLWIREINRLHAHLFAIIDQFDDPQEALRATAVAVVRYTRDNPESAFAMTMFSQARLVAEGPENLREEASGINDAFLGRLWELTLRHFPTLAPGSPDPEVLGYVFTVVLQLPYGLIRPRIGKDIPDWFDDIVCASINAGLDALGTRLAHAAANR